MNRLQAANLEFLETWLGNLPKVAGVPVALAMTYELIQYLNWLTIDTLLKRQGAAGG